MKSPTLVRSLASTLFAGAVLTPVSSFAAEKSGMIVGETWTQAMSPIRIVGDILVANLTIEPGVEVVFTGSFEIVVAGRLIAAGEEDAQIHFRGDLGVTWKRILFQNSGSDDTLRWCLIENAGSAAIHIIDSYPRIENCEFENNTSTGNGAGLQVALSSVAGNLDIRACTFRDNSISGSGAGAWINAAAPGSTVRFFDCHFIDNLTNPLAMVTGAGGGGASVSGNVEFIRCSFDGNTSRVYASNSSAWAGGGGLFVRGGQCITRNTWFNGNAVIGAPPGGTFASAVPYGGAIFVDNNAGLSVINCIITGNSVTTSSGGAYGGGICVSGKGSAVIENSTIVGNTKEALFNTHLGGTLSVLNSILWANNNNGVQIAGLATVNYSNIQNGYTGTGNMNANPVFNPDYSINQFSPLIDKGAPNPAYNDLCFFDPDTTPWGSYGTARNDMGAHGGPSASLWQPGSGPPDVLWVRGGGVHRFGDTITITPGVKGVPPFNYQWSKNGSPIMDDPPRISGSNTDTLVILDANEDDAGEYTVLVTSPFGNDISAPAVVEISPLWIDVKMFAGVIIQAEPGKTVRIEYSNDLSQGSWMLLSEFVLPRTPYIYFDEDSPNHAKRFYRAVDPAAP